MFYVQQIKGMKMSQELFTLNRTVSRALIHPFSFKKRQINVVLLLRRTNIYRVMILNQNLSYSSMYVLYVRLNISYKKYKESVINKT